MRRRFALVFNSRAGVALPRLLDGVLSILRKSSSAEVFQLAARNAAEATQRVRESVRRQECDAVIAAGGDGTFRAVAAGASGSNVPVGLIPLGTGNVLAHEIQLTRRPAAIADVLLSGSEIVAQGGLINGEPFFLMAGAGFDAAVVSRLNYRTKRALGRAAYTYPVLKTLAEGAKPFDLELDGRRFEAGWVILTFASRYGGSFVLTRETAIGTGRLIAVVIEGRTRLAISSAAVALALGSLAHEKSRPAGVHVLPVSTAKIGRQTEAPIEIDGDSAGMSPITVTDQGPSVRILVPAAYVADLTNRHTNRVASYL